LNLKQRKLYDTWTNRGYGIGVTSKYFRVYKVYLKIARGHEGHKGMRPSIRYNMNFDRAIAVAAAHFVKERIEGDKVLDFGYLSAKMKTIWGKALYEQIKKDVSFLRGLQWPESAIIKIKENK
jgi:hypothetical protein